jgi:hypothetical protein
MRLKLSLIFLALFIFISCVAAEDVRVEGNAIEKFERIGAWGWTISIDKVISGPSEMEGGTATVYLTSANPDEYPPGSIDPNIVSGDRVAVYGQLETIEPEEYDILLVGSREYYIKPIY